MKTIDLYFANSERIHKNVLHSLWSPFSILIFLFLLYSFQNSHIHFVEGYACSIRIFEQEYYRDFYRLLYCSNTISEIQIVARLNHQFTVAPVLNLSVGVLVT